MRRLGLLLAALALTSACVHPSINTTPVAPAVRPIAVNFTQPITSVNVWFDGSGILTPQNFSATTGRVGFPDFPATGANPSNVHIRADGYQPYDCVTSIPDGSYDFFVGVTVGVAGYGQGWFVGANGSTCPSSLTPIAPPFPQPATRDAILKMCMSFQGLNVQTSFGNEPYFEASLAWHDQLADRQAIYAAKHASRNAFCPNGDTHAMIFVPWGHPLYDEAGQFYTADKFPAIDWTNNSTAMDPKFIALVTEVIQNGFIPVIVGAEDLGWVTPALANHQVSRFVSALQTAPVGDLTKYVSLMPGFDGVFYGWANDQTSIPGWASSIRTTCPLCNIVIEHQTGHIPLGEGPSDWTSGGAMQVYDALYSEFNDDQFDDTVWQIGARTLGLVSKGGTYVRPAGQPSGDDPNPPYYIPNPNPRGKIYVCAMEFGTYGWVRRQYDNVHVAGQRAYFQNIGYSCGG